MARTIPEVARDAAERFGGAHAVVDGERAVSFVGLWDLIRRSAAAFARLGLRPGERVGLWSPNRLEWIVACAGAQTAGGVVVPLNTRLKGAEAAYILNKARARFLVLTDPFLGTDYRALLADQELAHLDHMIQFGADWDDFLAAEPLAEASIAVTSDDPADIMFTSGTTGDPKGVVATHSQTVRTFQAWVEKVGLREGDRYLIVNPFFHSFG